MCLVSLTEQCKFLNQGRCVCSTHGVRRFAGSDSTASTMQSFFYLVLNAPRVYAKLSQEVKEAQEAGKLSEIVTYAEAQNLPYFQACLKEAMRVRPAVGLGIYRRTPPEGVEIGGKYYPGGIEVAVNGWVLHRDASIFGDDVEEFRPDRWFERDAKLMTSHLYQVSLRGRAPMWLDNILTCLLAIVWRWFSSLHRPQSCPVRDEQNPHPDHEGIRDHACAPGPTFAVSFDFLRCAGGTRGVSA